MRKLSANFARGCGHLALKDLLPLIERLPSIADLNMINAMLISQKVLNITGIAHPCNVLRGGSVDKFSLCCWGGGGRANKERDHMQHNTKLPIQTLDYLSIDMHIAAM